jgi:hypothetical protein
MEVRMLDLDQLHGFILAAKASSYVGDDTQVEPRRPKSHDIIFMKGDFSYRDSYFGGSDSLCEEVVYHKGVPVWGTNYYDINLKSDKIDAAEAGEMIKASLSLLYTEGKFLGGWQHQQADLSYYDTSTGT